MFGTEHESLNPVVLQRFQRDLGPLWTRVAPLCHSHSDAPLALIQALRQDPDHRDLTYDLEALVAGWSHYDASRRAVLAGTVACLADPHSCAAGRPDGERVDDERIVAAAVRAILSHDR